MAFGALEKGCTNSTVLTALTGFPCSQMSSVSISGSDWVTCQFLFDIKTEPYPVNQESKSCVKNKMSKSAVARAGVCCHSRD